MNKKDVIQYLLNQTRGNTLEWAKSSSQQEYQSFADDGSAYTIANTNGGIVLSVFDENGIEVTTVEKDNSLEELFLAVKSSYLKDNNYTFDGIEKLLCHNKDYGIKPNKSLRIAEKSNPNYIAPYLKEIARTDFKDPEVTHVILISALGATGKSEMTKEISYKMHLPIFDLAAHPPVGSNSLLGLLFDNMSLDVLPTFMSDLKDGKASMLIDALDEAYAKTNQNAFDSFLDDIVKLSYNAKGVPFVIFGRNSILEYAFLYLEEKHISSLLVQIEPFTIEQAKTFIDVQVGQTLIANHQKDYIEIRDHILNAIKDFFKDDARGQNTYARFIGYAPVLQAIATLIANDTNIHILRNEVLSSHEKNIELILEILEWILERERGKLKEPLQSVFAECPQELRDRLINNAYSLEEQCVRLLRLQMGSEAPVDISDDIALNTLYEETVKGFFDVHPFKDVSSQRISNVVFESYIIAKLIANDKYHSEVIRYLKSGNHVSYLLFDIYKAMYGNNCLIPYDIVQYLITSFQSTDKMDSRKEVIIEEDDSSVDGEGIVACKLSLEDKGKSVASYTFELKDGEILELPSTLSNISINVPIDVALRHDKIEIFPPVNLLCKGININADGIIITPTKSKTAVVFECEAFSSESLTGANLQYLSNKGNVTLKLITQCEVHYPFNDYKEDLTSTFKSEPLLIEKYTKMRRMLLQFRSHSRGMLAKYKSKIDNRFGRNKIGSKVLDALKSANIITEDNTMYYIDSQRMADVLGVKYDDLRSCEINDLIIKFLTEIEDG